MQVEEITVDDAGQEVSTPVDTEFVGTSSPEAEKIDEVSAVDQPVDEQAATMPQEDRSAFNCPDCKGEGLLNERTVCPKCSGTGKV